VEKCRKRAAISIFLLAGGGMEISLPATGILGGIAEVPIDFSASNPHESDT
jgi:hypothetical protein